MISPSAFSTHYQRLNPDQKRAVDTTEGVVMVIAGPGTGKTQMLTLRIANILLTTQAEPENILALTYTEAGVNAMRQRLVSIIGPTGYRVGIFTFHGFANYLLSSHPEYFPETIGFEHISELEQLELIEELFHKLPLTHIKPLAEPSHYVKDALASISELKKEHVTPQAFTDALNVQEKSLLNMPDLYHQKGAHKGKMKSGYAKELTSLERNRELQLVYEHYEQQLRIRKVYDYEDMLLQLIAKFETNADFLLDVQEQFHYILIDEHQDTNAAQNTIVSLLASFHPQPNLFVVGDEKQAIYRFQGASLANFLRIKQDYSETLLVSLSRNYRSNQHILDNSHALIAHNPIPSSVDLPARIALKAAKKDSNPSGIQIYPIELTAQESWFVAWKIKALLDQGVDPGEIAVLTRKNRELYPLQEPLQYFGIPYVIEAKRSLTDDPMISALLLMLRATCELDNDELLTQVLFIAHFGIHPRDIIKITRFAREQKKSIWEVLDDLETIPSHLKSVEKIQHVYDLLCSFATLAQTQPLDTVFTTILKQSGLIEHIGAMESFQETLNNFIALYHEIRVRLAKRKDLTLPQFLHSLDSLKKFDVSLASASKPTRTSAVHLLTAHGAKGREFDYVFVVGVNDKSWGNNTKSKRLFRLPYAYMGTVTPDLDQEDANADERRLFYVALTRARTQVLLTFAKANLEGKELAASQFISELNDQQSTKEIEGEVQQFESWIAENGARLLEPTLLTTLSKRHNLKSMQLFVSETFRSQSLSVSALNNYLTCPWRYFFRNLVLMPEAKTPPLIFGSAIHQALSVYLRSPANNSIEQALDAFNLNINKQALTEQVRLDLITEGKKYLQPYLETHISHIKPPYLSELSITNIGISADITLSGKLDLVQILNTRNDVNVWDFKTGKPKSRNELEGKTKVGNGDYKRQLVFYKLLLNQYRGGKFKMVEGIIDFLKPKPNGSYAREVFVITENEQQDLLSTIERVAQEICSLSFWESRCDDDECEYCALRKLM